MNNIEKLLTRIVAQLGAIGKVLEDAGLGPKGYEAVKESVDGYMEQAAATVSLANVTEGLVSIGRQGKIVGGLAALSELIIEKHPEVTIEQIKQRTHALGVDAMPAIREDDAKYYGSGGQASQGELIDVLNRMAEVFGQVNTEDDDAE